MPSNYIAGEDVHFDYADSRGKYTGRGSHNSHHKPRVAAHLTRPGDEYPTSRVIRQDSNGDVVVTQLPDDDEFNDELDGPLEDELDDSVDDCEPDDGGRHTGDGCDAHHNHHLHCCRCGRSLDSEYDDSEEDLEDSEEDEFGEMGPTWNGDCMRYEYEHGMDGSFPDDECYSDIGAFADDDTDTCMDGGIDGGTESDTMDMVGRTANGSGSGSNASAADDRMRELQWGSRRARNFRERRKYRHNSKAMMRRYTALRQRTIQMEKRVVRHQIMHPSPGDFLWKAGISGREKRKIQQFWKTLPMEKKLRVCAIYENTILSAFESEDKMSYVCEMCGNRKVVMGKELEKLYVAYFGIRDISVGNIDWRELNMPIVDAMLGIEEPEDPDTDPVTTDKEAVTPTSTTTSDTDASKIAQKTAEAVTAAVNGDKPTAAAAAVADDLLRNNGVNFIDVVDQLTREEDGSPSKEGLTLKRQALDLMDLVGLMENRGGKSFSKLWEKMSPARKEAWLRFCAEREENDTDTDSKHTDTVSTDSLKDENTAKAVVKSEDTTAMDAADIRKKEEMRKFDEAYLAREEENRCRLEETGRLIQMLTSKLLWSNLLGLYKEKVAEDNRRQLLEELEAEDKRKKEKEEKDRKKKEKQREKKRLQQQAREEERKRKKAEKEEKERKEREEQLRKTEEGRKKKEAARKKREEEQMRKKAERKEKERKERQRAEEEKRRQLKKEEEEKKRKREQERRKEEELKKSKEEERKKEHKKIAAQKKAERERLEEEKRRGLEEEARCAADWGEPTERNKGGRKRTGMKNKNGKMTSVYGKSPLKSPRKHQETIPEKLSAKSQIPLGNIPSSQSPLSANLPGKLGNMPAGQLPVKLPSQLGSQLPGNLPTQLPSQLPNQIASKLPSQLGSPLPAQMASPLPTQIPSQVQNGFPGDMYQGLPGGLNGLNSGANSNMGGLNTNVKNSNLNALNPSLNTLNSNLNSMNGNINSNMNSKLNSLNNMGSLNSNMNSLDSINLGSPMAQHSPFNFPSAQPADDLGLLSQYLNAMNMKGTDTNSGSNLDSNLNPLFKNDIWGSGRRHSIWNNTPASPSVQDCQTIQMEVLKALPHLPPARDSMYSAELLYHYTRSILSSTMPSLDMGVFLTALCTPLDQVLGYHFETVKGGMGNSTLVKLVQGRNEPYWGL